MSRATNKSKDVFDDAQSDSASSVDSEADGAEDNAREETPDLYRNSALGMYAGEMDDGTHTYVNAEDDEMDLGDDDVDEDEEMDFADQTDSDDTSVTDEDGDDDEMDDSEGESAGEWDHDEHGEDEDDLVPNEDDEDDDGEDDGEDDMGDVPGGLDEGEADMMWQDIDGEDGEEPIHDEREDDDGPVHILHEEDEEAPDMASDEEEELTHELDVIQNGNFVRDMFGLGHDQREPGGGLFMPRRHGRSVDDGLQIFGRPRPGGAAPESTTHPLLIDETITARGGVNALSRGSRAPPGALGSSELLQTIEELVGGGAVQLFHHIMTRGRGGGGPETIRLDVPAGALVNLDRAFQQHRRPHGIASSVRVERAPKPPLPGRELEPLLTLQRWSEENKIIHGDFVTDRATRMGNHLTLSLLPTAIEAEKEKKAKLEKEAAERERLAVEAREAEEQARKDEEQERKAEQDKADSDAKRLEEEAAKILEDATSQEAESSQSDPGPSSASAPSAATEPTQHQDQDTEMADATDSSANAGPSTNDEATAPPERVTVMIHGSAIDITDTGIDPTFLEALPDEMREEVLNQHVRDQRAARIERAPDSQISDEFLSALPPEIRVEIIQQEALERSRRRDDSQPAPVGTEIDPASFIASLDSNLREAVLLESDDGFIQTLPPHMIAEADDFRSNHPRAPRHVLPGRSPFAPRTPSGAATPRKPPVQHDAIHLLDKQGLAVLVRLLFFPQVLKKTLLFKVLLNLCENSKTRTELFNLLLSILQDGTGDLAAVDKSFSQMSFRSSKPSKSPGKSKAVEYFPSIALPNAQGESVPDLIAQRCLEALTYVVSSNQNSSLFFLTEHELPAGLKKSVSKKGKGKEKQLPQSHYPIVLLLSLLDRQSLLRTPSIMESVVGLLATVTRPLTSLKDRKLDDVEPQAVESTEESATITRDASAMATDPPAAPESAPTEPSSQAPAASSTATTAPILDATKAGPIAVLEEKILLTNPPQIPHPVLRLIVNILTVGECSGRTFQQSLALIQHLSCLPDARDVIAQELRAKAQEFGQELFQELDELVGALQTLQGDVLISSVATRFSAASSVQAKLLRVLKTIDYMYTPKQQPASTEDTEKVQTIYESFRFAPLWQRLGDCLAIIEEKPDTEHVATVLLPLIEALMVVCKYVGSKASASASTRALRGSMSPKSPTGPRESMEDIFVAFTDAHRKILNLMVRNNPSLMSGSFSLLVHNPRVLDFDNKRNYFTQQLHKRPHPREHYSALQLNVRRARVFEDSFQHLQRRTGDQIKYGKLSIRFYDEEGVDAGGLTREWFQILARQMFDPNNALFQPCAADKLTYQPNKNSWVNPEHLSFFKFVGRVIGKAIYDGRLLDAYFARSLYRQLLGKPVDYKDVEWVDPEYYNSLLWILNNDPTPLDLTFSVEADEFGINRIVPLMENGEGITVTNDNKREFVQLSAQYRLYSSIKDQIEAFSTGFYEIVPKDLITIFNEQELELLISGTPDIDVDEWRAATEYNGYTSSDPNIVWWWRALKSFTRDERAKVLSFATGTSRVPLGGFGDLQGVQGVQKFSIHRAYGESDRLPSAHTCFNQIDLPQYSSYDMLRQQLLTAISEGAEGFGFV